MDCISFIVWVGSGVFLVPLLQWLKKLPSIGPIVEQWAWILAPLLAAVVPVIAESLKPYCAIIDPQLWVFLYAALVYLVSQIVYYIAKKTAVIA